MGHLLITSGPTRQFIDPVRYLTNASSGRMGCALTQAALNMGHQVTVVSGPVEIDYPPEAEINWVVSTEEMHEQCHQLFPKCDGVIGVAAPCDYRPLRVKDHKIVKTGEPLVLHLVETPDVVASLGAIKHDRWVVGFALETEDHHFRAITKLERKSCDLVVLNHPEAMNSSDNEVDVIAPSGDVVQSFRGPKESVARGIMTIIQSQLIDKPRM